MRINVETNIKEVAARLQATPRTVEIATQRALLGTARAIKDDEVKEMGRAFDRPTRWTLNSFRVGLGKEERWGGALRTVAGSALSAFVEVKDSYWYRRADNFLKAQIEGASSRSQKAFEKALQAVGAMPAGWVAVPGERARLDAYGNHAVGEIRQILSWFDAAEQVAGSTQNMGTAGRDKRKAGTKKKAGWEYFVVRVGARRQFVRSSGKTGANKMQPGIYRRTNYAMGSRIEPVVIFVRRAAYKPRFDFYGVAQKTAARELAPRIESALRQALEKVRA